MCFSRKYSSKYSFCGKAKFDAFETKSYRKLEAWKHEDEYRIVINSLFQQRACMENILRATRGLQPLNNMHLEWKLLHYK